MLSYSAWWVWEASGTSVRYPAEKDRRFEPLDRESLARLAMPQAVLAVMALSSYHVQIITRLSSGYPLWYIWLASLLAKSNEPKGAGSVKRRTTANIIVRWMAIYTVVQAGLFASFLPPA